VTLSISTLRLSGLLAVLAIAAVAALRQNTPKDHTMPHDDGPPKHTNKLIDATSPYLLQHAHNPVDWYEWGAEALEKARKEDKPIFLSIGYSACHWCHVMAHESFENEEIAAVMNERFVCIKVDREERPDLDEIYMRATVILNNGNGGWPMSVWMTPDLEPFYAGTYFPPESRFGRPGFKEFCERVGNAWKTNRDDIVSDGQRLAGMVDQSLRAQAGAAGGAIDLALIDRTAAAIVKRFDKQRGGISGGGSNKFPPSMTLDLFLRTARRQGEDAALSKELLAAVNLTLTQMARGGIYDQLAGGIHRYSTDVKWLAPHFEKMLYDQALVSRIYTDAWQVTRDPFYKHIATDIFDYVIDDWQSPEGGIYSTRDADSEGEEGKYYVWTKGELDELLPEEEAELFRDYYAVSERGNWQDPHDPGAAKNILHVPVDPAAFAKKRGLSPEALSQKLAASRAKLLEVRAMRVPPGLDDKILVEWNGMMIASLARGGAAFDEPKYIDAAAKAANFILEHQYVDGRLMRAYRAGRKLETAFLTDYALLIEGLLELYEATFDRRWLDVAVKLNKTTLELYWDDEHGGFYFTADDHEKLISRSKDVRDSATPSGNSVQLMNMLRLATMLGDSELASKAEKTIQGLTPDVLQSPAAADRFLAAVEFALVGPAEIAIVGDPKSDATHALLLEVNQTYLPNRVVMLIDPAAADRSPKSPLLENRPLVDGKPAAYVCRNYACKRPVTTAGELRAQLAER
jgi:hypothetical protein